MSRAEWAVLLAVLTNRAWDHHHNGQNPAVNLWNVQYGVRWLSLSVPEKEAP